MANGIVNQSLAALRKEPFERSEMVNQLLFGEAFEILESFKGWVRIRSINDGYEGWIDQKLCLEEGNDEFIHSEEKTISNKLFSARKIDEEFPIKLCPGSTLYSLNSNEGTFMLGSSKYKLLTPPLGKESSDLREFLVELSQNYINAPYLWGGRSPYGIDCSGLTQVLFKQVGRSIPRDSGQQVNLGQTVEFIEMAKPGDLAFFDDEEGNIVHVGLIYPQGKIVHASGFVRVDFIDHQGIFSMNQNRYTHKLRVVKNILG